MKTPNITPGPWAWSEGYQGLRAEGIKAEILTYYPYEGMFLNYKNQEANATAIAALPDLMEALIELVGIEANHSHFGGEMYQDRIDKAWEKARAALLKAGCTDE